jgi:hypothetical protein
MMIKMTKMNNNLIKTKKKVKKNLKRKNDV